MASSGKDAGSKIANIAVSATMVFSFGLAILGVAEPHGTDWQHGKAEDAVNRLTDPFRLRQKA
jgi:hypothetical protein